MSSQMQTLQCLSTDARVVAAEIIFASKFFSRYVVRFIVSAVSNVVIVRSEFRSTLGISSFNVKSLLSSNERLNRGT